ncbi:MAG: hypothetical protein WDN49_04760 [Acetobacteraceae bacterium]
MTLLDFARGPALQASVLIMIAGIFWRLAGILLQRGRPNHATPRHSVARQIGGALSTILSRFIPRRDLLAPGLQSASC